MNDNDISFSQIPEEEMKAIDEILDHAIEYGLEVEVIYWALQYIKKNPQVTPSQAMFFGVSEWIK